MRFIPMLFKIKSLNGLSLVEVMVVIMIFCIILGAIYMLYSQGVSFWQTVDTSVEVTQDARKAMDTMIKELANSADEVCTINTTLSTNDTIIFQIQNIDNSTGDITWGNTISYFRGGTSNRQLIKTETGLVDRVLCNNLENTDIDGNGVIGIRFNRPATGATINVTLQTTKETVRGNILSTTLINRVRLRN